MNSQNDTIFVFGSNLAGIHGAGAAYTAHKHYGAERYVGSGPTGQCYALPTKDRQIMSLPLPEVKKHVETFLEYAKAHPDVRFKVTCIGCGLAGFHYEGIAPMFIDAPSNCYFDTEWENYLGSSHNYWGTFP